jgi:hypothetical protein
VCGGVGRLPSLSWIQERPWPGVTRGARQGSSATLRACLPVWRRALSPQPAPAAAGPISIPAAQATAASARHRSRLFIHFPSTTTCPRMNGRRAACLRLTGCPHRGLLAECLRRGGRPARGWGARGKSLCERTWEGEVDWGPSPTMSEIRASHTTDSAHIRGADAASAKLEHRSASAGGGTHGRSNEGDDRDEDAERARLFRTSNVE